MSLGDLLAVLPPEVTAVELNNGWRCHPCLTLTTSWRSAGAAKRIEKLSAHVGLPVLPTDEPIVIPGDAHVVEGEWPDGTTFTVSTYFER